MAHIQILHDCAATVHKVATESCHCGSCFYSKKMCRIKFFLSIIAIETIVITFVLCLHCTDEVFSDNSRLHVGQPVISHELKPCLAENGLFVLGLWKKWDIHIWPNCKIAIRYSSKDNTDSLADNRYCTQSDSVSIRTKSNCSR